jgi:hypothetical protein
MLNSIKSKGRAVIFEHGIAAVEKTMIEKNFDIAFIADLALREKQIQQNCRPIIAVHKWFARRPGTLFREYYV